jgi:hypothetical protein
MLLAVEVLSWAQALLAAVAIKQIIKALIAFFQLKLFFFIRLIPWLALKGRRHV